MHRKALFLDRDGVVNIDKGYVYQITAFEFVAGIFDICRYFQEQGYLLIIVTNQSGIARKLYTEADYAQLTEWMVQQFKAAGITINKVYHCPDHPDFTKPSQWRKPNPGMLLEAAKAFELNLTESVLIGDKPSDLEAAKRAGIKKAFLTKTNEPLDLTTILTQLQNTSKW
ncbi:D-glycero-beta-D-manno-heptose 1,7-bisphosphate 7-phosphatase [Olivibacter ginsenosidimutans]|uniref:D,D-heptose 1,7-bisphosphate phosphatase n=1 Tax=Olivibacter ginsenosidimutans TaxID=1176537 RepID=A0ABP9AHG0_9SPHI